MQIGFIGLGTMGAPMALNLLKAGFDLKIHDIELQSERVKRVVTQGAKLANTPREAAIGSEYVFMSLPAAHVSLEVTLGKEGILSGASPRTVIVELSTVTPLTVRTIADAAIPLGVDVLDAPVSGGKTGAEEASLTIMIGGKREIFNRALPILRSIGKKIFYVGALGSGETVKLLNQMIVAVNIFSSKSVLEVATKIGVDPNVLHSIINSSTGQSWVWTNWVPKFLNRQRVGSTANIFYKDLNSALKLAEEADIYPETAMAVLPILQNCIEQNHGGDDLTDLFGFLR